MKAFWNNLSNIGISENTPEENKAYFIFSNRLAFIGMILMIPYLIFFVSEVHLFLLPLIFVLLQGLVLIMNKLNLFTLSRLIQCILPSATFYILFSIGLAETDKGGVFYMLNIVLLLIPFLLFAFKEKAYIIISIIFSIFFILSFDWMNNHFNYGETNPIFLYRKFEVYNYLFAIFVLVIGIIALKSLSDKYQSMVNQLLLEAEMHNMDLERAFKKSSRQQVKIQVALEKIKIQKEELEKAYEELKKSSGQ